MSFINKMLKDLEQRNHHKRGFEPFPMPPYKKPHIKKTSLSFMLGIVVVVGSVCALYLLKLPHRQTLATVLRATTPAAQAVNPSPWTKPLLTALNEDNNPPAFPSMVAAEQALQPAPVPVTANTESNATIVTPAQGSDLVARYSAVLKLIDQGQEEKAVGELNAILQNDPGFKDARVSLAAIELSGGNYRVADKLIAEGLNADASYAPFIELRARLLTVAGKINEALALLQTNAPAITDNPEYHAFMAALYERNNDNALAARIYQNLLNQDPANGSWWFGLGVTLEKLGKSRAAYTAYNRAASEGKLSTESALFLQNRLKLLRDDMHETE